MKLKLVITTVVLLCLAFIGAFVPFEATDVPEWRIRVIDQAGRPVAGVTVQQYWKNYTLDREPGEHTEEKQSDANGHLTFDRRTSKASVAGRLAMTALRLALMLAHGSIGVTARVTEPDSLTTLRYERGRPLPHEIIVFRSP